MAAARLNGKVALVTGGGTGIGAAIARRFVESGASVVITGRRLEPLTQLSDEIGCTALSCDVGDMDDCIAVISETVRLHGGLDILVSNAGILCEGSVTEQDLGEWQKTLDTNVSGVMHMARAALPALLKRPSSAIINISSVSGISSGTGMSSYVTSKTAVVGLTRSLALDYGPKGVRVNALCPGWVRTPMSDDEMMILAINKGISVAEATEATTRHLPLRRMAEPDEIASCAEFLGSDDSSFITGSVLVADGGGAAVDVGTLVFDS
ncbi:MAG: SDR family oxidoreductase [Halopseudomonas sp.]